MPPDTTQQNNEIIRRIEALEGWKREREREQIKFPLDQESIDILNRYFLRVVDVQSWEGGVSARNFLQYVATQKETPRITSSVNRGVGINKFEFAQLTLFQVNINQGTDQLTLIDKIQNFDSGNEISFLSEDTPPGGITALGLANYKINNLVGHTFNITDTANVAINITDSGVGRLFMQFN